MQDVIKLLDSTEEQIEEIHAKIKKKKDVKVLLKNALENLMSALDYIAVEINNQTGGPKRKYFPYGEDKKWFKSNVNINVPKLKSRLPEVYKLIENVQLYKSKDTWLTDLKNLTNEAKHNWLSKVSEELKSADFNIDNTLFVEGAIDVEIQGISIGGRPIPPVVIDCNGELASKKFPGLEIISYNRIKFKGKELDIVDFLKSTHNSISTLHSEIMKYLKM